MSDEQIAALREEVRKLQQLLGDPHPGLFTWVSATFDQVAKIHGMTFTAAHQSRVQ